MAVVRCRHDDVQLAWAGDVMCLLYQAESDGLRPMTQADRGRKGITNAVGIKMRANTTGFKVKSGDRILLCSDGIWENVDESEMLDILRDAATPREAAVRLAIGHDNQDDATAVVLFADTTEA